MAKLKVNNLTKIYDDAQGQETAVDSISFETRDGEFVVIVGPSGCGKSTTLRMIAGLESVTEGTIEIGGQEVQELIPSRRRIAMVFQNYAIYSTMSVRKNMEYGLKHSTNLSKQARQEKVEEMAELLGIQNLLENDPSELSGGQRQRVALGRAIVRDPDVFLLDEPLSNLDAKLRSEMRTELLRIQEELGVTTIYVTHDQKEAMTMADRLAIMEDGTLHQIASPEEAYYNPTNRFVATFLGSPSMNVFDEVLVNTTDEEYVFTYDNIELGQIPIDSLSELTEDIVTFGVRPEDWKLHDSPAEGSFSAEVAVSEYQGNDNFIHLYVGEKDVVARTSTDFFPEPGDTIGMSIARDAIYLFNTKTGASIKTPRGVSADMAQTLSSSSPIKDTSG